MVFEAESLEEVRKIVENDIYYTTGVVSSRFHYRIRFKLSQLTECGLQWDPERLAIYPFATRLL